MKNKEIDQHILNYLQGTASVDEIESIRAWIKEDKANKAAFETIRAYWSDSSLRVQYPDIDAAYLKLKSMSKDESEANIRSISPVRNHWSISWIKYAAALFLVISLSALLYLSIDQNKELPLHENVKSIVKQNPKGQKLTTFLPDGSKVILNSESRIEYLSKPWSAFHDRIPCRSLMPIIKGEKTRVRDFAFSECYGDWQMIQTDKRKYIRYLNKTIKGVPKEELYDLKNDPNEQNNLILNSEYKMFAVELNEKRVRLMDATPPAQTDWAPFGTK